MSVTVSITVSVSVTVSITGTASNLPKLVISTNANNSTVRTYTAIVMMVDVSGRPAGAYP